MEQFNIQQGATLFMVNAKLHGSLSFAKHKWFTTDQNGYITCTYLFCSRVVPRIINFFKGEFLVFLCNVFNTVSSAAP
jgi:hypothetical protein